MNKPTIEYLFLSSKTIDDLLKTLCILKSKGISYLNGKCFTSIDTEELIDMVERLYRLDFSKDEIYESVMNYLFTR